MNIKTNYIYLKSLGIRLNFTNSLAAESMIQLSKSDIYNFLLLKHLKRFVPRSAASMLLNKETYK